jgi:hypothetical protein
VGANIKAYVLGEVLSITCKTPMEKVAVFPVPDYAYAIVSLPLIKGIIPFY